MHAGIEVEQRHCRVTSGGENPRNPGLGTGKSAKRRACTRPYRQEPMAPTATTECESPVQSLRSKPSLLCADTNIFAGQIRSEIVRHTC